MAALTTAQLLHELRQDCRNTLFVHHIEERVVDIDILSVRVHMAEPDTFVSVFYNLATDKTAFALIRASGRIYGVDNAKMGWHRHPFDDPEQHVACEAVSFAEFMQDVEKRFAR